jgi:hypothetical protein
MLVGEISWDACRRLSGAVLPPQCWIGYLVGGHDGGTGHVGQIRQRHKRRGVKISIYRVALAVNG